MKNQILRNIDEAIAELEQTRKHLIQYLDKAGELNFSSATDERPRPVQHHNLTPEGRLRISTAVKRRWASKRAETGH